MSDTVTSMSRDQLLQAVSDLAASAVSVVDAAGEVGLCATEFRELLASDDEVGASWTSGRCRLRRRMAEALVAHAENGQRAALQFCRRFLRAEQSAPGEAFDYEHLPTAVVARIIGKTSVTVHNWQRDGMGAMNADGSFDLSKVVEWMMATERLKRSVVRRDAVTAEEIRSIVQSEIMDFEHRVFRSTSHDYCNDGTKDAGVCAHDGAARMRSEHDTSASAGGCLSACERASQS